MNWTQHEVDQVLARMRRRGPAPQPAKDSPRSKYSAIRTLYRGVRYDSKAEAAVAQQLDLRVAAGELLCWKGQVTVKVVWPGTDTQVLSARLDFQLFWPDGRVSFLEYKGYAVRDWPLRLRILRAAGVDLEVVGAKQKGAGKKPAPSRSAPLR